MFTNLFKLPSYEKKFEFLQKKFVVKVFFIEKTNLKKHYLFSLLLL